MSRGWYFQLWLLWQRKDPNLMLVSMMLKGVSCKLPSPLSRTLLWFLYSVFSHGSYFVLPMIKIYSCFVELMGPDLEVTGKSFSHRMMRFMTALPLWDCRRTFFEASMHMVNQTTLHLFSWEIKSFRVWYFSKPVGKFLARLARSGDIGFSAC